MMKRHITAYEVAQDDRGHKIGDIIFQKMKKLVKEEGGDGIYVSVPQGKLPPDDMDDMDGVESAKDFWIKEGIEIFDCTP